MAASDQTYRDQKLLHIIFGVSSVLMLVSIIGMFIQDYFRPFKREQRLFRDVEAALANRAALNSLPDSDAIAQAEKDVEEAKLLLDEGMLLRRLREVERDYLAAEKDPDKQAELQKTKARLEALQTRAAELRALQSALGNLQSAAVQAETDYQAVKADFDSITSFYNIAVEHHGFDSPEARAYQQQLVALDLKLRDRLRENEKAKTAYEDARRQEAELKKILTDALDRLKKVNADFDRIARNAAQKQWKWWKDGFLSLPVIDGFASPIKIHQITLDDLPIDYAFKYVTRFDRCTTCHLGIDRATYSRNELKSLSEGLPPRLQRWVNDPRLEKLPDELKQEPLADLAVKLKQARALAARRQQVLQGTGEDLGYKPDDLKVTAVELTPAQVTQFCAHPRLDLFVGDTSPHPKDKFGCTICHGGQGSATDFTLASHTPNDSDTKRRWQQEHHWERNHYWEFPMLPGRFVESSCLKCHHQVTELVRGGSQVEAPKLVEGFRLVEQAGCFGCHEIAGWKNGRRIGPDLRLEPTPPLEDLPPEERARLLADPSNPPGTYRKVGPSLYRLAEKTNPEWTAKWLKAPRDFRPTTWMPHFYGLSNNDAEALAGTGQDKFPDAEIRSIVHYLFERSRMRDTRGETPLLAADHLPPAPKDPHEQVTRGRQLFSEKGCLACHQHEGTTKPEGIIVASSAHYGPDLTRIADKLGTSPGDKISARRWLVQWILNPSVHSPRTLMPVTHLSLQEADDIAAWLLSQPTAWKGPDVATPDTAVLQELARVYLKGSYTRTEVNRILAQGFSTAEIQAMRPDNDERELAGPINDQKLMMYVGKKAIGRLGCFGCHNIAGFENAKPIGTPLNDWGKKDPERLAFEDAVNYVERFHVIAPRRDDPNDPTKPADGWVFNEYEAPPFEEIFFQSLKEHQREGFLHLKLADPRSYDFARNRSWEERLRMPQFKFARVERRKDESDVEFRRREAQEEAQAREKVMTFILGLLAEPVPEKFVYKPAPDRQAEIRGHQVLVKYNCGGCHQIRPGTYDFKLEPMRELLEQFYQTARSSASSDHPFPHPAWVGNNGTKKDRLSAQGFPDLQEDDSGMTLVRLSQSLRFTNVNGEVRDIPAGASIGIPREHLLAVAEPYGGTYADLLVPYLAKRDRQLYGDAKNARAAAPPPLLRQGEKVQPAWLFHFLKNPHPIRPVTVLRMPKFSLSDDEAQALVNYFAAVDKLGNPTEGLTYPYLAIPQREDGFLAAKSAEYVARLKQRGLYEQRLNQLMPVWERMLQDRIGELELEVQTAEAALKAAKDDAARKAAQDALTALTRQRDDLKAQAAKKDRNSPFFTEQRLRWEQEDAYAADAYRLVASYEICLNCHQVGPLAPKQAQGPSLNLTWERLRPAWTLYWIANPDRLLTYPTPMPQNFPADKKPWPAFATAAVEDNQANREQIMAVRDILMNLPRAAELPVNRYFRPPPGGEGVK